MSLLKKLFSFLKSIFIRSSDDELQENELEPSVFEELPEEYFDTESCEEDRISLAKRTLMTKLYTLEQDITVFESDFPEAYQAFMEKIDELRKDYNSSLNNIGQSLTFEIDPELDYDKLGEVIKLEKNIKRFIETEVKFDIISKRLQRLIIKLNILYNISIFHSKQDEKQKVISQLEHALISATKISHEFKDCYYILCDTQLTERIVELLSYVDYEIFKTSIRNSNETPDELIRRLVMLVEFNDFDYISTFRDFIKDEISDLSELLPLIDDEQCRKVLREKLKNLLTILTYSNDAKNQILDTAFWNSFFDIESSVLEILRTSGIEKEKAKVRIINKMNVSIDESEVLVLPITNAYLSLTSIFSTTHNEKILLLIKLLKNISNDVTYKEIYFLLLLFDAIEVIENTPNELTKHIEKYLKKYPYDTKTINMRKKQVISSSNKEYVVVFTFNRYEKNIITTLENLNIDFKVVDDTVLMNSFYFNGLENVLNSLQKNTKNIMKI